MRTLRLPLCVGLLSGLGLVFATLPGCSRVPDPWPEKPGPRVLASFAPVYCFALNVAGDDATVKCLMSNDGPHHFNPSPSDAVVLKRADLFIINGLELDDGLAKKLAKASRNKNLKIVEAGEAIPVSELREGGCHCADEGHDHGDADHEHGKYDPHVWLGIPQAITMVEAIRDALKEQDPAHAANYDARSKAYVEKLNKLLAEGRQIFDAKKDRKLLAFHDSLSYFARAFHLEIVDSIEVSPGVEPDPKTLSELIQTCKEKNVRVIAVEPQYDANTSAKVILRELNKKDIPAEFATVDPLETARTEDLNADFYEKKMRENIRNLADKLK